MYFYLIFLFSDTVTTHIYTRYGQFTKMTCCLKDTEFDTVTWYKLSTDTQQWYLIQGNDTSYLFEENNQVLMIESVQLSDKGDYKCIVSSQGAAENSVDKQFHVSVATCDPLARGPFAIAPLPCEKTFAKTGDTVVLPCAGYFGCDDGADVRMVTWYVSGDGAKEWVKISDIDPKYHLSKLNR